MDGFEAPDWERHWQDAGAEEAGEDLEPIPYLVELAATLSAGSALDAGCGTGTEAIWLAHQGWTVTAVDIARTAVAAARVREARWLPPTGRAPAAVDWVVADLTAWEPPAPYDLVTSHYAHASIPQLAFYARIAGWVAPGGTLLVVGHGHGGQHRHGGAPPEETVVQAHDVAEILPPEQWEVTVETNARTVVRGAERIPLRDVVLRARRRPAA